LGALRKPVALEALAGRNGPSGDAASWHATNRQLSEVAGVA